MYLSHYELSNAVVRRSRRPRSVATADAALLERSLYAAGIATCAVDEDWTMIDSDARRTADALPGLPGLPDSLLKAYNDVCTIIANLRASRDALHKTTVGRLQHTTEKLHEVTNATELAATSILDSLDRSLTLVDTLEGLDASGSADAVTARGQLRDELYQTQAALQFQDITTQQLNHAASMLVEMEQRLVDVARSLDPASADASIAAEVAVPTSQAFDPNATVHGAEVRQALADAIFTPHD